MAPFELWNDGSGIPVFAFSLKEGRAESWNLYHLSERMRIKEWLLPSCPMPVSLTNLTVQRIVVRNGLSHDLAAQFRTDLRTEGGYLEALTRPLPTDGPAPGFHH